MNARELWRRLWATPVFVAFLLFALLYMIQNGVASVRELYGHDD